MGIQDHFTCLLRNLYVGKESAYNAGDTEMQVCTLDREDSLEEEMATDSSILAWKIPQTEESGKL